MDSILLISLEPPGAGGVGNSVRRIGYLLSERYTVHILTVGTSQDTPYSNAAKELVTTFDGPLTIHLMHPYAGSLTSCPPQELQHLHFFCCQLHQKHNFTFVHAMRIIDAGFLAILLKQEFGTKAIISIRGNDIGRDLYDATLHARLHYILEHADAVTSVNAQFLDKCRSMYCLPAQQAVIWNSIYPDFFYFHSQHAKKALDLKKKYAIGFFGKLRSKKGGAYLFEAFHKFRQKIDSQLICFGGYIPEEESSYKEQLHSLNVSDIHVVDFIPHQYILNYMKICDVIVVPSISDGCPNVIFEAMYAGIPVIASSVGVVCEYPDNVLYKILPHSGEELYRALLSLFELRDKADQFSKEGHSYVTSTYTWHHEQQSWFNIYDRTKSVLPKSSGQRKINIMKTDDSVKKLFPSKESYLSEKTALTHPQLKTVVPSVLSFDESTHTITMKRIPLFPYKEMFFDSSMMHEIGKTIAGIHVIEKKQVSFEPDMGSNTQEIFSQFVILKELYEEFKPQKVHESACHNDLHPHHIFYNSNIKIIDWDKWGSNFSCLDIGYLLASFNVMYEGCDLSSFFSGYHQCNPLTFEEYRYGYFMGLLRHLFYLVSDLDQKSDEKDIKKLLEKAEASGFFIKQLWSTIQ